MLKHFNTVKWAARKATNECYICTENKSLGGFSHSPHRGNPENPVLGAAIGRRSSGPGAAGPVEPGPLLFLFSVLNLRRASPVVAEGETSSRTSLFCGI